MYEVGDKFRMPAGAIRRAFLTGEIIAETRSGEYILLVEGHVDEKEHPIERECLVKRSASDLKRFYEKVENTFEEGKTYRYKGAPAGAARFHVQKVLEDLGGYTRALAVRECLDSRSYTLLTPKYFEEMEEVADELA